VVISAEAVRVDKAILLDYLTSEVALKESEIGSTDTHVQVDNNRMDDELNFGKPGGSRDYNNTDDGSDKCDDITTASWRGRAATNLQRWDLGTSDVAGNDAENGDDSVADDEEEALEADDGSRQNAEKWGHSRFDLGTSIVDGYEGEDGNNANEEEEEEASQVDDGSMQNVEDWGHSTVECEDWTVYFRPVKYDNGEANATASDVPEGKTWL